MFSGEYYLRGVMEVGSGFRFNADGTFDFFFAYGVVDRVGKGTFEKRGDSLVLHSDPKPERDFVLQSAKTTAGDQLVIRISHPNSQILEYVECAVKTARGILNAEKVGPGHLVFEKVPVDTILIYHQLWSDGVSEFVPTEPGQNFFEFTFDPRIGAVDFNGIVLKIEGESLVGRHPLLNPEKTCYFEKSN